MITLSLLESMVALICMWPVWCTYLVLWLPYLAVVLRHAQITPTFRVPNVFRLRRHLPRYLVGTLEPRAPPPQWEYILAVYLSGPEVIKTS